MSLSVSQLSSLSLWEAVRPGDVHVCCRLSAPVPLLRPGQRSSGRRPLFCKRSSSFTKEPPNHLRDAVTDFAQMDNCCFDLLQVDVALTLLTLLVFIHPVYVFIRCRKVARHREDSAQTEVANGTKMAEAKL